MLYRIAIYSFFRELVGYSLLNGLLPFLSDRI